MRTAITLVVLLILSVLAVAADIPSEANLLGADPTYFAIKAKNGLDPVAANIKTKQLLHGVQLGLERYSVDDPDEHYPESIDVLIREGYLVPGMYVNPVTSVDGLYPNARDVPFGWSNIAPGNFTYLKKYDQHGKVIGYAIVGYGATLDPAHFSDWNRDGFDDGKIIILESGLNRPDGSSHLSDALGSQDYYAHGEKITVYFGKWPTVPRKRDAG
jgi:hypothetical protein